MPKLPVFVLVSAIAFSPVAVAERPSRTVTADIHYDASLLSTPAGVSEVLASIESQAKQACHVRKPVYGAPATDHICVDSIITAAVAKILDVQALNDTETERMFARLTSVTEQR